MIIIIIIARASQTDKRTDDGIMPIALHIELSVYEQERIRLHCGGPIMYRVTIELNHIAYKSTITRLFHKGVEVITATDRQYSCRRRQM